MFRAPQVLAPASIAAVLCLTPARQDAALEPVFQVDVRPFVARYCASCHGAGGSEPEAGLVLTGFKRAADLRLERDTWEYVRERVENGEMPPTTEPRPEPAALRAFLEGLDAVLESGAPAGRTPLHRLNNTEYANAVRDLVGVDYPVARQFPADPVAHGFDTVGEALSLSDLRLERYLEAAGRIAARAIVVEEPSTHRYDAARLEGPRRQDTVVLASVGNAGVRHTFPRAGEYLLRARAFGRQAGPDPVRMAFLVDGREVGRVDVEALRAQPGEYEARAWIEQGQGRVAVRFLNDYYRPEDPDPAQRDRNLHLRWLEVEGPLDPPPVSDFQRALFEDFARDLGGGRLRAMLQHLMLRVWRRPADALDLARLERLVAREPTLESRVQLALEALLASPNFLLIAPRDPARAGDGSLDGERRLERSLDARPLDARSLDDWELATRLSLFLWSTTPDAELLAAAARGELARAEGLEAQVTRLLQHPRSRALAEGFAAQWLQVRRLEEVEFDPERFPAFDPELRAAMGAETLALFDAVLREERSAWDLLEADYTFIGERLARHYGLAVDSSGAEPRRVSLAGTPRRGVLGHASVLAVTSDPTRTSPVKRGKWVLEVLLGAPPPPPPPGVGNLGPEPGTAASMRERLERHRGDPACASCHARMDPLGFGLENYDAIGAWRATDGDLPVDAAGELPDGRRFDGPLELVGLLRADDAFLRNLVSRLLVYALRRAPDPGHRRAVNEVLASIDAREPSLAEIVRAVATSDAFTRRATLPQPRAHAPRPEAPR